MRLCRGGKAREPAKVTFKSPLRLSGREEGFQQT